MPPAGTLLNSGKVNPGLKQMVAYVTSNAAGCRYCQAQTSNSVLKPGISAEKMARALEFDQSDLFSDAERASTRRYVLPWLRMGLSVAALYAKIQNGQARRISRTRYKEKGDKRYRAD